MLYPSYCDDADIGIYPNDTNPIIDLFRTTENATVVSSQANEAFPDCPVYTPNSGMDCQEAKEECQVAIVKWLLEWIGPMGMWLNKITSALISLGSSFGQR